MGDVPALAGGWNWVGFQPKLVCDSKSADHFPFCCNTVSSFIFFFLKHSYILTTTLYDSLSLLSLTYLGLNGWTPLLAWLPYLEATPLPYFSHAAPSVPLMHTESQVSPLALCFLLLGTQ